MARALLIVSTGLFSWLAMMIVHEFGHVLHAWLSDGTVVKVVLHPLSISRTDVRPNPHPLFVVWGGPIWGCLLPALMHVAARRCRLSCDPVLAFWTGFCLVANGVYLGVGSAVPVGDAADLLRFGSPPWVLIAFGICTTAAGMWRWNGLGQHFGFGSEQTAVDGRVAGWIALMVILIVIVELALSSRV